MTLPPGATAALRTYAPRQPDPNHTGGVGGGAGTADANDDKRHTSEAAGELTKHAAASFHPVRQVGDSEHAVLKMGVAVVIALETELPME